MELSDSSAIAPMTARCVQCGQTDSVMRGSPEYERALSQEPFVFICEACKRRDHHEALVFRYTGM